MNLVGAGGFSHPKCNNAVSLKITNGLFPPFIDGLGFHDEIDVNRHEPSVGFSCQLPITEQAGSQFFGLVQIPFNRPCP